MDQQKKTPWYNKIEQWVIVVLFTCMTAITFFTVCSRYIFNFTFSWAEQMTRLMLVWVSFAGISWAAKINAHNRVTVVAVVFKRNEKVAQAFLTIGDLIGAAFGFYMAYQTGMVLLKIYNTNQMMPSMQWCPKWFMYLPGVIGMLGFSVRTLQRLYGQYIGSKKKVDLSNLMEGGNEA